MENTLENKAKFFALYWGQLYRMAQGTTWQINERAFPLTEEEYLELTPLSDISDKEIKRMRLDLNFDANGFDNQKRIKSWVKDFDDGFLLGSQEFIVGIHYWLINNGFAVSIPGAKVETLVSWGWVKLTGK